MKTIISFRIGYILRPLRPYGRTVCMWCRVANTKFFLVFGLWLLVLSVY